MEKCIGCGGIVQNGDIFCRLCGAKIQHQVDNGTNPKIIGYCSACGQTRYVGTKVCPNCGGTAYRSPFSFEKKPPLTQAPLPPIDPKPRNTKAIPLKVSVPDVETKKPDVSNTLAWLIAFAPILGVVAINAVAMLTDTPAQNIWWMTYIITIGLSWWDMSRVQLLHPEFMAGNIIYLIPVYLYKRAKLLKHSLAYFIVWIVTFSAVTFIPSQYYMNNPLFNFGLGYATTINSVKHGYFENYPSVSVGDALDGYLDDEKWTSFTTDSGINIVQVNGYIPGTNSSRQYLVLQFTVGSGDSPSFNVHSGTLDGRTLSSWELFFGQIQAAYDSVI